jgi:hypothetical protein
MGTKSLALCVSGLLMFHNGIIAIALPATPPPAQDPANTADAPRILSDQMDSLVAPIALYPDLI